MLEILPLSAQQIHNDCISFGKFSSDGSSLCSVSRDRTACIWDVETMKPIQRWVAHSICARSCTYSVDGNMLFTAGDSVVLCWDPKTGKLIKQMSSHMGHTLGIAASSDGRYIAASATDGCALLWNLDIWQLFCTLGTGESPVFDVSFSCQNDKLAGGCGDRQIRLWRANARPYTLLQSLKGINEQVIKCKFGANDSIVSATGSSNDIGYWTFQFGIDHLDQLKGHDKAVKDVCFCGKQNEDKLLSASEDGTLGLWSTHNKCRVASLNAEVGESKVGGVSACDHHPNTAAIFAGYQNGKCRWFRVEEEKIEKEKIESTSD